MDGRSVRHTFTVLTTFPDEVSSMVHDRVPATVRPKDYQRWLDPENEDVADILARRRHQQGVNRLPGQPAGQ